MKVFGVIGWKNSGKTGLVVRLVEHLTARGGYTVSTIKNSHHSADVDHKGTDSWRHRQAGAREVVLASEARVAQMHELRGEAKPTLPELLTRLGPPCDIAWSKVQARGTPPQDRSPSRRDRHRPDRTHQ